MSRRYIRIGKHFGENSNSIKEAEVHEAIIKQRIANCPEEIRRRCYELHSSKDANG